MTFRRNASVIATCLVAAGALQLGACSTVKKANPFHGRASAAPRTEAGQRISLLELNDQLKVSDSLKGQDFFLPPAQPQADWPVPGGSLEQSVEHVAAAPEFQIAWRRTFGAKSARHADVMAPPIIADGKIFVMDGNADVSAHDAKTGAQLWRIDLRPKVKHDRDREGFGGGLAYSNGKIYAASGYRLVAELDASNGHVDWLTHTDAPVHDAPTVADGRVYAIDVDDELLTFNAANGTPDWTYQALTEPARMLVASSPAVSNGTLVASFASGELVALREDNGTELWNAPLSHTTRTNALSEIRDIAGRPVIYKGDVFAVSHADVMAATNLRTGDVRWTIPLSGSTSPWPVGDVVYAVDTAGDVICAARDSGQLYWMTDLNAPPPAKKGKKPPKRLRTVWSGPLLASDRLVIASDRGEVVALDPKTGAVQKRLKISDDTLLSPIAADGMIYIATEKADLIAIR
jgi:outer membrane protein assembly factor BamB